MQKLATIFVGAGLALSANAQESVEIGSEAFGDAVREYLMENPGVIFEAVDVYNKQQEELAANAAKETIAKSHDALYNEEDAIVIGNPDASFAVVEFIDYNCGYCRKSHSEMDTVLNAHDDVKVLVRQLPILSQDSLDASKVVLAVKELYGNEAALEMHNSIYNETQKADLETALAFAESQGHSRADIEAALGDEFVFQALSDSHQLAESLEITGTPGFVIGDELLHGYVPAASMNQIIDTKKGS